MKTIFSFLIIGLLFLIACNPQSSSPPVNEELTPPPITEPEPEPEPEPQLVEVPLSYEVVDSFLEQDSFSERRRMIIGGEVIQDEVVEVFFPIGCVTVKNTDGVAGEFTVNFSFYAVDKFTFDDLQLSEDEDAFKFFSERYDGSVNLTLNPGETNTARYNVPDIDLNADKMLWEFEVIPSTKLIEQ